MTADFSRNIEQRREWPWRRLRIAGADMNMGDLLCAGAKPANKDGFSNASLAAKGQHTALASSRVAQQRIDCLEI